MIKSLLAGNKELNISLNQELIAQIEASYGEYYRKRYIVESISPSRQSAILFRYDINYQPCATHIFPEKLRIHTGWGSIHASGTEKHNKKFNAVIHEPVNDLDGCVDTNVFYHWKKLKENDDNPQYGYGFSLGSQYAQGRVHIYTVNGKNTVVIEVDEKMGDVDIILKRTENEKE